MFWLPIFCLFTRPLSCPSLGNSLHSSRPRPRLHSRNKKKRPRISFIFFEKTLFPTTVVSDGSLSHRTCLTNFHWKNLGLPRSLGWSYFYYFLFFVHFLSFPSPARDFVSIQSDVSPLNSRLLHGRTSSKLGCRNFTTNPGLLWFSRWGISLHFW